MKDDKEIELVTPTEFAKLIGTSYKSIMRLIRRDIGFPVLRMCKPFKIMKNEALEYMRKDKIK